MTIPMDNTTHNTLKGMYLFNSQLFQNDALELGSNIMLFGTNGAGKTTTLSLLAFFSTGNQKLFKQDKQRNKNFYDYFFPMNNSFIVYEYEKEEHNVLVAVYTKEGIDKLEFSFIAMEKDSYTVSDIFNADSREAVFNEIDKLCISSTEVSNTEYLNVLYGDSKKENTIYMFSHVRNYKTYSKLHYSSFKNIAIDSTAVKNIILEYAYSKDDMSRDGVSLEKHGGAIEKFQSDHAAIMEWKKNHHTIGSLRESLLKLESYEKRKSNTLLKIKREWQWYVEISQETESFIADKQKEKERFDAEEFPAEEKRLKVLREEARKKLLAIEQSMNTIRRKMDEYQDNKDLLYMLKELPKLAEYQSEWDTSKKILTTLQEKNKSASEMYEVQHIEIKKHYEKTVQVNNSFFLEQKEISLSKKLEEGVRLKKAEKKARNDFRHIDKMKEELALSDSLANDYKLEEEKIKLTQFSIDERCIAFQLRIEQENKKLFGIKDNLNEIKNKEKVLSKEEESFLESQRKVKETNRIALAKELDGIREELDRLEMLSQSDDTLFSKITHAGLDIKKYTGILKLEALESNDFSIKTMDDNHGMQVFDFELAEDTELIEMGETLYQKKKVLEKRRDDIKHFYRDAAKTLEKEYGVYFASYRESWKKLQDEKESITSNEKSCNEALDTIEEEKKKAEESWEEQKKIRANAITDKLLQCKITSSRLRADIKNMSAEFELILTNINSNLYDEKIAIRQAEDECNKKNTDALTSYKNAKKDIEESYKKILESSGISVEEVEKYTSIVGKLSVKIKKINEWEMTIREYERFIAKDWIRYEGLRTECSQEAESFSRLDKKTDEALALLSQKGITIASELKHLDDKKNTLKAKSSLLLQQTESYADELAQLVPLSDKTDIEKQETNFNTEADELLSTLMATNKSLHHEKDLLTKYIARYWGTFIAKGSILFSTNPLDNARRIVVADNADEMGVFADGTYQSINLAITAITSHYDILQEAYSTVKNAINRINKDLEDISSTSLIESIKLRAKDKHSGIDDAMYKLSEYWKLNSDNMQQNLFSTENSNAHKESIMELLKDFLSKFNLLSNKEKTISVGSLFDLQGKIIEKGNESDWEDGALGKGSEGTRILIKAAITASLFSMALSGSRDKQIPLLLIDEIGKLHNDNVQRVLEYVNKKGSYLVAVQPNNSMAKFFDKAYLLDEVSKTQSIIVKYLRRKVPLKMKETLDETLSSENS